MNLLPADIAKATGLPWQPIFLHWPNILEALQAEKIDGIMTQIGVAATVATETLKFEPIAEIGSPGYFTKYDPHTPIGRRLGNLKPGDGYKYRGQGFVQLTGLNNFKHYGNLIGEDLVTNPDRAREPEIAAKLLAIFFKVNGVARAAEMQDWRAVRKLVNGGYNGWDKFHGVVQRLLSDTRAA